MYHRFYHSISKRQTANRTKRKLGNDPKCQLIGNIIMAGSPMTVIEFEVLNQIM